MKEEIKIQTFNPIACIGFSGSFKIGNAIEGINLHPDNEHLIYPLGSVIVIRHIISRAQSFLRVFLNRVMTMILVSLLYLKQENL